MRVPKLRGYKHTHTGPPSPNLLTPRPGAICTRHVDPVTSWNSLGCGIAACEYTGPQDTGHRMNARLPGVSLSFGALRAGNLGAEMEGRKGVITLVILARPGAHEEKVESLLLRMYTRQP